MIFLGINCEKSQSVIQLHQEIVNRNHPLIWLADSLTEGVCLIDPYGKWCRILYVNKKFTAMTGYSNDEIVGHPLELLGGAETNPETRQEIENIIRYEKSATTEILIYHKDGTPFWQEVYLNPLYDNEGELFAYIGMQKEVQASQPFYDTHTTLVSFINTDGIIERSHVRSPSFKPINKKVGQHFTESAVEEDKEKLLHAFRSALNGNIESIQTCLIHNGKQQVELDIIYVPSYSFHQINGVHAICRNITGHRQASKLVNNAEKYQTVKKMALTTVDVISPLLVTLRGFIALAYSDTASAPNYLNLMLPEIDRIEQMITGYSLFSQPRIIKLKEENLRELLEHVCTFMYTSALRNNVTLTLHYDIKEEKIECHDKHLTFVITQLVKNAIEAMPSGGSVQIEVTSYDINSILIRIIDEGGGIAKEELNQVMKPFYTTKKNRIGLGLLICNNVIKEHNGSLTLTSQQNKGTIANIVLPIVPTPTNKIA